MKDELDFFDYIDIIRKRKMMIITLTLVIVLITLLINLIIPKTYESTAVIQTGQFDTSEKPEIAILVPDPWVAKNIILSSVILDPVIDKFFVVGKRPTLEKFMLKNLEVDVIIEGEGLKEIVIVPLIRIKVKSKNPEMSQDIAQDIADRSVDYLNGLLDRHKGPIIDKFNSSITSAKEDYNYYLQWVELEFGKREMSFLDKLELSSLNINELEEKKDSVNAQIGSLSNSQLSSEGISKSILFQDMAKEYYELLMGEKTKSVELKNDLKTFNQSKEHELEKAKIEFNKKIRDSGNVVKKELSHFTNSMIISYPELQVKFSKPDILFNLSMAAVFGLFFSVFFAFFYDGLKKR